MGVIGKPLRYTVRCYTDCGGQDESKTPLAATPSFNVLQNYNHAATPLHFYAFDLLHLAGKNLRDRPLDERRELLRAKVMPRMPEEIRFSETLEASGC